jgi:hypothetical protein
LCSCSTSTTLCSTTIGSSLGSSGTRREHTAVPRGGRVATLVEVRRTAELLRHGLTAGIVAGITLVAEEMVATGLLGGSASDPFRLVASVAF